MLDRAAGVEDKLLPNKLEMLHSHGAKYAEPLDPDPFDLTVLEVTCAMSRSARATVSTSRKMRPESSTRRGSRNNPPPALFYGGQNRIIIAPIRGVRREIPANRVTTRPKARKRKIWLLTAATESLTCIVANIAVCETCLTSAPMGHIEEFS